MKTKILLIMTIMSLYGFAQDSLKVDKLKIQIFSLSPISKNVDKVNGLAFGIGHFGDARIEKQTVNGLNIEANPGVVILWYVAVMSVAKFIYEIPKPKDTIQKKRESDLKIENWNGKPNLKINGINLSTGYFFIPTSMNGLNISLGNKFKNLNGVSIAPLGTIADNQNGLSIGIVNANNVLIGSSIGIYNQSYELKGLQIGIFNQVKINKGLQIGIFNKSFNRGFQIGFWNKNKKHSFPLINW